MALSARQPFAEIGSPRLQALSSLKNKQNSIIPCFTSPLKPSQSSGKRRAPATFEDEDSENMDPSIFNSPTKKSKTSDGLSKPSQFSLVTSPAPKSSPLATSPLVPSVRKALSSPNTSNSTPISLSRGSPKHKRIGHLSKRRTSSSPFKRVDPPTFTRSGPSLPFSIDAALSGTIPSYTPKATTNIPTLEESMPKSWFFDIHEDTLEQEAANLMEHSASVLDISSDDDCETKRRNEELERGKENIPPPDFLAMQAAPRDPPAEEIESVEPASSRLTEPTKLPRLRKIAQDAMDEDRLPLSDLPAADFYGPGLDATSYITVDAAIEKPSSLSKEFNFSCPTPTKEIPQEEISEEGAVEESIPIFNDDTATATAEHAITDIPVEAQDELLAAEDVASEMQETSGSAII